MFLFYGFDSITANGLWLGEGRAIEALPFG